MRAVISKYVSFLFHPHGLLVGVAFLAFLVGAAVYAEDTNNRSDHDGISGDRLSAMRASAGSSNSCLECKAGYAASSGEHKGMASVGTEDAEVAAVELDLTSGRTSRAKEGSPSAPAFRCPETTFGTEALTGAGLINLFVSFGIVTVEKAMEACRSLPREPISGLPTGGGAFRFSRPLAEGMAGPDVRELQRFLNAQGFPLSQEGSGSPGNETEVFGDLTVQAVKRFQTTYSLEILDPEGLSVPSGVFGLSSIKKANEILSAQVRSPKGGRRPPALK